MNIICEVIGNPFEKFWQCDCDPEVDSYCEWCDLRKQWTHWNNRLVPTMARTIYDERRWEDLPIFADALEDAGCDVPQILDHLRSDERYTEEVQAGLKCPQCGMQGIRRRGVHFDHEYRCGHCDFQSWEPGTTVTVVRTRARQHCRGCFAIDWILNKS